VAVIFTSLPLFGEAARGLIGLAPLLADRAMLTGLNLFVAAYCGRVRRRIANRAPDCAIGATRARQRQSNQERRLTGAAFDSSINSWAIGAAKRSRACARSSSSRTGL